MAENGRSELMYKYTSEIKVEENKMKTIMKRSNIWILFAGAMLIISLGCERSVDGLDEPGLPANPEVFINGFSAGLEFFAFEGSRLTAFTVDSETTFGNSALSMRFDVPNEGDPEGAFAGGIFRDDSGGRDLTSFNALTFYAKGTIPGTINDIGFGQDFFGNEFEVTRKNLKLTTNWRKYIVPIPDASKLTSSRGLLWLAEGPENGDGYSFWIDEVKYENLSDLAQPRAAIMNGSNVTQTSFAGSGSSVTGLSYTINQANGVDVTVSAAPAYFTFNSSNTSVATIDEKGEVSVVGMGTAIITATMGSLTANGSLTIESGGSFSPAPTPTDSPSDVISIFSDAYDNVPVDHFNGFWEPFQTTTSNDFEVDGNSVLGYENFNFVGIEFHIDVPTIDGSEMTNLRMDLFFPDEIPPNSAMRLRLVNDVGGNETVASTIIRPTTNPALVSGQWISVDMDITGLANRSNLGQIIFDADEAPGLVGSSFFVDNIYLRK
jgi:hypothetical protein